MKKVHAIIVNSVDDKCHQMEIYKGYPKSAFVKILNNSKNDIVVKSCKD